MKLFYKLFNNNSNINNEKSDSNKTVQIVKNTDNKTKCNRCGSLVNKSARFCCKCGNQLGNAIDEKVEKDKVEYKYPDIELIKDKELKNVIKNIPNSGILNIPIGLDKDNNWLYYDITKMPNLLIGGTVMSGKTNMINFILLNLISKYSVDDIRIIIADSKRVDYSCYNGEPHLLFPVIKDVNLLEAVLKSEYNEMENRYSLLNSSELKKISDYNKINELSKVPYHLIFIDDYTIFSNNYKGVCSLYIESLAKKGWNVGIHLVIVANHPTVDVLTAISQLNFPVRISFRVTSIKDSKIILEAPGAEKISGIGNALINSPLISKPETIHTDIIDDDDITSIINDLISKNKVKYNVIKLMPESENNSTTNEDYEDPLYNIIKQFVVENQKVSASLLQRRFKLGYNRAVRMIDLLEERGVIGPVNGSKPREVLINNYQKKGKYLN